MTDTRKTFEAWASTILGDNPNWKESADCELAWQAWRMALAQHGEPVAWCELSLDGRHIAFFDGKPIIMVGPVGNDCHKTPLYAGAAPAVQHPTIEQVLNCYSPDDTATDYQNKLIDLFKAAPAAQPLTCDTCKFSAAGKDNPAIRIHDETCFECSQYYADRHESNGIGADK